MHDQNEKPKRYTKEFRDDAVRLVETGERSLRDVSEALGVNFFTLRNWRSDYRGMKRKKKKAESGENEATPEDELKTLRKKNRELERENAQLKMDREILKKAAAFFAKESE